MCPAGRAHTSTAPGTRVPGQGESRSLDGCSRPEDWTGVDQARWLGREGAWAQKSSAHQKWVQILILPLHISVKKLVSLVFHFLICQRGKSKIVEEKRKQAFHVPNVQETVVSAHTHTPLLVEGRVVGF